MVAVILFIIVILLLVAGGKSRVLSYYDIEEKIVEAGMNYYYYNKNELPEDGTISIDVNTLIAEGYLNDLSTYTEEDVYCNGRLHVTKNPSEYSYRATLNCGSDYVTKTLKEVVMKNINNVGNGLYEMKQVNPDDISEKQTVYVFKGDGNNNYVKIGDYYWEIIKIYENGEMAILGEPELLKHKWDDRYNIVTEDYDGINDYKMSRIYEYILTNIVNTDDYLITKRLITPHTACIGNRDFYDTSRDGSVECSQILTKQYFSLLPAYDYLNSSMDENCKCLYDVSCYNYNYLSGYNYEWWLMTATKEDTDKVFYVDGDIRRESASKVKNVRLYAHLDSNVTYVSGTGSYEDPYIVK